LIKSPEGPDLSGVKTRGIFGSHEPGFDVHFFALLEAIDLALAERVREARCPHCGGRLDRSDYARKPRGVELGEAAPAWSRRLSLCCSREGCRRRATPPSVRFLGRRVYIEVVVLLACAHAQAAVPEPACELSVPRRTVRRWLTWWRTLFVASVLWRELRGRFAEPPDEGRLPSSLLARLPRSSCLLTVARLLLPLTTGSVLDRSCFMRVGM
jgi:hypothetical protein